MKLIIDIDDNVFTQLFDNGVDTSSDDREVIDRAVRNGMPYNETLQCSTPAVADRTEEVLSLQNTIAKLVEGISESARLQGEWLVTAEDNNGVHRICCPFCSYEKGSNNTDPIIVTFNNFPKFCENCGADMRKG